MTVARIPFTPSDESAIRTLVGTMLFLLIVNFVIGGLMVVGSCFAFLGVPGQLTFHPLAGVGMVMSALGIVLYGGGTIGQGVLLLQIRRSLEQLVQTDSQDQSLMADAFAKLRIFFLLEAALFAVGMFLSCGGFLTQGFGPVMNQFGGGL
ncbi:MAG: hypothetical protein M3Y87_15275 [Myxococcota bacterium]|nr:hypothetical protein [Myxococcota bacterium]